MRISLCVLLAGKRIGGRIMARTINPFEEIERFVSQMSRQFEDTSRELESTEPFDRLPIWPEAIAVDIVDDDEAFLVTADLPGFDRDEVDVRVTDRTLEIDAEHEETVDEETDEGRYIRHERRHESTSRTIHLPATVETDEVDARMEDGVLHITLPKSTIDEGREIEIAAD